MSQENEFCLYCGDNLEDTNENYCSDECEECAREEEKLENTRMTNFYWKQKGII